MHLETLTTFDDARGASFEPVAGADLARYRHVHVVWTRPGHVRGNHRHRRGAETLVVRGPALLVTEEGPERETHEVEAGRVVRVEVPAGVAHAILNTGAEPMLIVSFSDAPHDPADTERVVLLPVP